MARSAARAMQARSVRIPHGDGWFSFCRGAMVPRRAIFSILLGRYRAKIEHAQSNDLKYWG